MSNDQTQNTPDDDLDRRQTKFSEAFKAFITGDWEPYDSTPIPQLPASEAAVARRKAIAEQFADARLVIPAGNLVVRSNDTDYRFRPHSAFAHLTGLGTEREPDAVLVLEPTDDGVDPTLYFRPRAPREDKEFYADARYGEMWVGQRDSLDEMSQRIGISCAPISELGDALAKNADSTQVLVLREADPGVNDLVDDKREHGTPEDDDKFATALSELRLIKDEFEIEQMREACDRTADGFEAIVADLPEAVQRGRGERWVEGVFGLHARHAGNDVGYGTIAAAGDHANTLHWVRNDGDMRDGDLILIDAGVELDSLYTADITRTLPINGTYTEPQRRVYDAVLEAADAAIAVCRPGTKFADVHQAAIKVLAARLHEWGLLPVTPEESVSEDGGQHRRWMVHGTSHHLGIDVHDCAQARNEQYREGVLEAGMIITVEPGLYFKISDQLVPDELRGIGVRLEDDILITDDGYENLSNRLPRTPDAIEAWMAPLMKRA